MFIHFHLKRNSWIPDAFTAFLVQISIKYTGVIKSKCHYYVFQHTRGIFTVQLSSCVCSLQFSSSLISHIMTPVPRRWSQVSSEHLKSIYIAATAATGPVPPSTSLTRMMSCYALPVDRIPGWESQGWQRCRLWGITAVTPSSRGTTTNLPVFAGIIRIGWTSWKPIIHIQ